MGAEQEPEAKVTPGQKAPPQAPPPAGDNVPSRDEKVEYRDEHGNLLNEEQVAALEGKVSFQTRYETRTRVVDAQGNELYEGPADQPIPEGFAPPHPDVEGQNPETKNKKGEADANEAPPSVPASAGDDNEKSARVQGGKAKPASEQQVDATKKEL